MSNKEVHNYEDKLCAEVDALSITFWETTVTTKHLAEGIAADYDRKGQLSNAIREFREALKYNPAHPDALSNLGAVSELP